MCPILTISVRVKHLNEFCEKAVATLETRELWVLKDIFYGKCHLPSFMLVDVGKNGNKSKTIKVEKSAGRYLFRRRMIRYIHFRRHNHLQNQMSYLVLTSSDLFKNNIVCLILVMEKKRTFFIFSILDVYFFEFPSNQTGTIYEGCIA